MSKYIFYAELTAEIELSNEELNLLIECSERHYDTDSHFSESISAIL